MSAHLLPPDPAPAGHLSSRAADAERPRDTRTSAAPDDERRRAQRFEMALTVKYRRRGEAHWTAGFTLNVSRCGVLVNPSSPAPLRAGALDFVLSLPPCGIVRTARIRGTGRVVRLTEGQAPAFALSIDRYRFLRTSERVPQVGVEA